MHTMRVVDLAIAAILTGLVIALALQPACRNQDKLSSVASQQTQDASSCQCVCPNSMPGAVDIDGGVADADPAYQPRPGLDADAPDGPPDTGGVPCVRWAPDGGTCWFLSGESEQIIDVWCEDSIDAGREWCECLGLDWQAEQMRAHALMGAFRYCPP